MRGSRRQWGGVWGEGVPSPLKKGSGEGAVPLPRNLKKKFWFNVFKKFLYPGQRGGIAQCPPPPKYTTVLTICSDFQ